MGCGKNRSESSEIKVFSYLYGKCRGLERKISGKKVVLESLGLMFQGSHIQKENITWAYWVTSQKYEDVRLYMLSHAFEVCLQTNLIQGSINWKLETCPIHPVNLEIFQQILLKLIKENQES